MPSKFKLDYVQQNEISFKLELVIQNRCGPLLSMKITSTLVNSDLDGTDEQFCWVHAVGTSINFAL